MTSTRPVATGSARAARLDATDLARVAVMAAVVAVLLVGAGIVIWQAQSRAGSADEAAHAYLRALESGDAAAVQATGIDVSDEALQAFDGAHSVVSEATVVSVEETGSSAVAHVSFVLGDAEHDADLALTRSDGRWVPDGSGLAEVTVSRLVGPASPQTMMPLTTAAATPNTIGSRAARRVAGRCDTGSCTSGCAETGRTADAAQQACARGEAGAADETEEQGGKAGGRRGCAG